MSLKAFHMLFIAVCLALGMWLAVWGTADWLASGEPSSMVLAVSGLALAIGTIPYSFWFAAKLKKVSYL